MTRIENSNSKSRNLEPPADVAYARKLCSRREYAVLRIRNLLLKKGVPLQRALTIVEELKEKNFISEERFAKAFVHDKSKFKSWGINKLKLGLRAEGVAEATIKKALSNLPDTVFADALHREVEKRIKRLKNRTLTDRQKLFQQLLRKGFESEMIKRAIEKQW
jgi:regulatory protein